MADRGAALRLFLQEPPKGKTVTTVCRSTVVVLCTILMASCGGSGESGPPPSAAAIGSPSAPPLAVPAMSEAAFVLFDAVQVHLLMVAAPLMYIETSGVAPSSYWKDGPCASGSGSAATLVDGMRPPATLPTGTHTISTRFANCVVDSLYGVAFDGIATVRYSAHDWRSVVAEAAVETMRATGSVDTRGLMVDVSAKGAGMWERTITASSYNETYSPGVGSSLTNNLTTRTVTFRGGSTSRAYSAEGSPIVYRTTYTDLAMDLSGVRYVLRGTVFVSYPSDRPVWSGEIRIFGNDVLAGRVYGAGATLRSEAFMPIEKF
jgi:hypothetical protein